MDRYTYREVADIHFVYGLCNGNANAAAREYARRYPNRITPQPRMFTRIHLRFGERGIQRAPNELYRLVSPEDEEEVLQLVTNCPRLSTRRIARRVGLSHKSVWLILRREGLRPFHFRRVQDIVEPDYARRIVFCLWINRQLRRVPNFLERILWTDEATFTRAGYTNHRNDHQWLVENPHAVRPSSFQHEFKINLWAGMIDDRLIGPIVLPPNLNGERFLAFLRNEFIEALEDIPLWNRVNIILQLDGAPAHFARSVRQHLDENFRQWIGREGTIAWPPRSPDLTPLHYFLWGTMKQEVYFDIPNNREQLLERIMRCADSLRDDRELIRRVTQQVALRATACIQNNGGHFEQTLPRRRQQEQ